MMTDTAITYTSRFPCSYCSTIVREGVECSGPYDAEGHATFDGGVECFVCVLIVCADCLPPWVGVGSAMAAPSGRRCKPVSVPSATLARCPGWPLPPRRLTCGCACLVFALIAPCGGASADPHAGVQFFHQSLCLARA